MMKHCLGLFLLLCCGMFHLGSGLQCYSCVGGADCKDIKECATEDACLSLSAGGVAIRQCFNYAQCNFGQLSGIFAQFPQFTFSCCQGNLCNSGNAVKMTTPILVLLVALLSVFWCWI